ncbi:hypothetical protein ALO52_200027 [Pseudomonas syringae pv. primulae]|uniref:Uncharacterized protein n=1 Tax=Pseudomonas syringae pv. primulae TaxID=251707 RepID=A0A0P9Y8W3_9PSED|nr:hypothetical protein [Pseudomonas syringae group genomosp. 3]KPY30101.1 hypothetical protein ALO52_200027 [Pseudomonas syringae pv. primulae]
MADLDKRISGYFEAVSGRQNGVALKDGPGFSGSREKFIAEINVRGTRKRRTFFNKYRMHRFGFHVVWRTNCSARFHLPA